MPIQRINTNIQPRNYIIFPQLSYLVVGICFDAHNELGRFAREKQYGDFIADKFKKVRINFKRELEMLIRVTF